MSPQCFNVEQVPSFLKGQDWSIGGSGFQVAPKLQHDLNVDISKGECNVHAYTIN